MQYVINGFGFLFVAGFTATNKLYGILEMAAVSYGYAITAMQWSPMSDKIWEPERSRESKKEFMRARFLPFLHLRLSV